MQTAVHTYPFRALSFEEALDEVVALGCPRVELWLGHVAGRLDFAAEEIEERGLELVALSVGGVYRADAPLLRELADAVGELRAPRVVGCVSPGLLPLLRAAVPSETEVFVENHWDQPLCGPEAVLRELDGLEGCGACLDTGHALLAGWTPVAFAHALGDSVGHVHLKEARRLQFWEPALGRRARRRLLPPPPPARPGTGALDVPALVDELRGAGYGGVLSAEFEGPAPAAALTSLLAAADLALREEARPPASVA